MKKTIINEITMVNVPTYAMAYRYIIYKKLNGYNVYVDARNNYGQALLVCKAHDGEIVHNIKGDSPLTIR